MWGSAGSCDDVDSWEQELWGNKYGASPPLLRASLSRLFMLVSFLVGI